MKMEALRLAESELRADAPVPPSLAHKAQIDILRTFFLRGPSIWTYRPILEAWIDIWLLEERPSNTIPGLYERLSSWLPGLVEHRCGPGVRGGFLMRLREGTWAGHILEHVMIELQIMAGIPTGFGKARETSRRGIYKVVVRTPDEILGRAVLHEARALLLAAIDDDACDVAAAVGRLRLLADERLPDFNTVRLLEAAAERRIPAMLLNDKGLLQLGYGKAQRRIWMNKVPQGSAIAQGIADDRVLARRLLRSCGVPVPRTVEVHDIEEACEAMQELGTPVAVRTRDARCVQASDMLFDSRAEVETAYREAREQDSEILVEEGVLGKAYRVLVVGGEVAAVTQSDNTSSPDSPQTRTKIHPKIADMVCTAVRIVGLETAEVQLIAGDITAAPSVQRVCVTDVNTLPDLQRYAKPEEAALAIIDHLFPKEASPLPIISISGSKGRTAVAHMVASLLQSQAMQVGVACGDGVYLGSRQIKKGNQADRQGTQQILRSPSIDAAIIEHRWHDILAEGLGYERSHIAIITGLDYDDSVPEYDLHDRAQMEKVVRTPVDVVLPQGAAVLNAGDPAVAALAAYCDGEVIYFGGNEQTEALIRHRRKGGRAVYARHDDIVFSSGPHTTTIAMELDKVTPQRLQQMLAAAAAAWAMGLAASTICSTLKHLPFHYSSIHVLTTD